MKKHLEMMDAELHSELAMNSYEAKLLRKLAELIDGRSTAQIVAVLMDAHQKNAKEAMAFLIESRRHIAASLQLLVLNVALEAKEQELTGGCAK
jgi:SpoVK/Ycf46/Vps4 family AAA+-type ATPase